MLRYGTGLFALILPCAAAAQAPVSLHANYDTYAAGIEVAKVEAGFDLGPRRYQMNLGYHTTGLLGFFNGVQQFSRVDGTWNGTQAAPSVFIGQGIWRGTDHVAEIDYQRGIPVIRRMIPPTTDEREPVPESLRANTIDSLSALMQLIRSVRETGRCETTVRTFDGRRAVEIEARTIGQEDLQPTNRSNYAGKALRCDFSGRMLAGFLLNGDRARDSRPLHGSAWLAVLTAGGPPLPVRLVFETRWFGDATMYLTGIGAGSDVKIARGN